MLIDMKTNSFRYFFLILTIMMLLSGALFADTFSFKYQEGEKYRILSRVDQMVYVNGIFSHEANILNRIAVTVEEVTEDAGYLSASFQTSEEAYDNVSVYRWGTEYHSEYWRDEQGYYEIEDQYFMPVVRNVPVFPKENLSPGDDWTAQGSEAHDFRKSFGIEEPLTFPIPVTYRYEGKAEKEGKTYDLIHIRYNVFYQPRRTFNTLLYPVRISGYSNQRLYWDRVRGRPHSYEEDYTFVFTMSDGRTIEWTGTAEAEVIESSIMDKDLVVKEVEKDLETLGIEDTEVKKDERGVTISLQNVQFLPDSAVLVDSEKKKLRDIAKILKNYPERDILITGHTALAGTAEGRQKLSEERAAAVGQFLLQLGVRERDRVIYRGMAAREPIADNSTAAGMRRNRRVEITILEN